MRLKASLFAALTVVVFTTPALAELNIGITSDPADLTALASGDQVTLTITLTTTTAGEAQGLTLRIADINQAAIAFDSATAPNTTSSAGGALFGALAPQVIPGVGTFDVYQNFIANVNSGAVDNGDNVVLFNGVTTGSTTGDGNEAFTATFNAIGAGTMLLQIGAVSSFGDAYVSTSGTSAPVETVTVTVPEPGAVAASLAALGSVFGVVAVRRQQDA